MNWWTYSCVIGSASVGEDAMVFDIEVIEWLSPHHILIFTQCHSLYKMGLQLPPLSHHCLAWLLLLIFHKLIEIWIHWMPPHEFMYFGKEIFDFHATEVGLQAASGCLYVVTLQVLDIAWTAEMRILIPTWISFGASLTNWTNIMDTGNLKMQSKSLFNFEVREVMLASENWMSCAADAILSQINFEHLHFQDCLLEQTFLLWWQD